MLTLVLVGSTTTRRLTSRRRPRRVYTPRGYGGRAHDGALHRRRPRRPRPHHRARARPDPPLPGRASMPARWCRPRWWPKRRKVPGSSTPLRFISTRSWARWSGRTPAGQDVARVHSGDPSLYGAIAEQTRRLDALGIPWTITPGVPAFAAAAATLGLELTLPDLAQSVILTRTSVRASAMPEGETLEAFARTGATLAIHLSINNLARVSASSCRSWARTCPVAIVYRASWPDELILRGTLGTIREKVKEAGITRTALILVGRALEGSSFPDSRLYAPDHHHVLRPRKPGAEAPRSGRDWPSSARSHATRLVDLGHAPARERARDAQHEDRQRQRPRRQQLRPAGQRRRCRARAAPRCRCRSRSARLVRDVEGRPAIQPEDVGEERHRAGSIPRTTNETSRAGGERWAGCRRPSVAKTRPECPGSSVRRRVEIGAAPPVVAGLRRPGRPLEPSLGMPAAAAASLALRLIWTGKGMRCVDEREEALRCEIARKSRRSAEAADAHLARRPKRRLGDARPAPSWASPRRRRGSPPPAPSPRPCRRGSGRAATHQPPARPTRLPARSTTTTSTAIDGPTSLGGDLPRPLGHRIAERQAGLHGIGQHLVRRVRPPRRLDLDRRRAERAQKVGQRLEVDPAAGAVKIAVALGQLHELAESAGQGQSRNRMAAEIFEGGADEIAHLDQGDLRQTVELLHGPLRGRSGGGRHMRRARRRGRRRCRDGCCGSRTSS